jgi:hypothetical protein
MPSSTTSPIHRPSTYIPTYTVVLWIHNKNFLKMLLTLQSHRNINIIEDSHHLLTAYLSSCPDLSVSLYTFSWSWSGCQSTHKTKHMELLTLHPLPPPTWETLTPKKAMWDSILTNYTPLNHPSHIACTPSVNPSLPPTILAVTQSGNHLISSTIFCLATGHCFDVVLHSESTSAFSPFSYTYSAPETWDMPPPSPTVVSEFPNVVPAHPFDILPRLAPKPFNLGSLM